MIYAMACPFVEGSKFKTDLNEPVVYRELLGTMSSEVSRELLGWYTRFRGLYFVE